jgi:hypothetical protein
MAGSTLELRVDGIELEHRIALMVESRWRKLCGIGVTSGAVGSVLPGELPDMRIEMT